ncbi:two-component system response regulator [Telmatospirillum sp. J64-1]|uniref:response regulator n=1 Tax=Telmatospirillum sp. J64-1 TaxID=2502183 RepID=UPI00163D3EEA|nr:response regulator [Telmatospirillum sp. J64-1]
MSRMIDLTALTYMVIDDSRYARSFIKNALFTYDLRQVVEAPDGAAGLEILREQRVDVILLDNEMPILNGIDFTLLVRKGEAGRQNEEIPIIMVSGQNDSRSVIDARNAGIHDFLIKPVSAEGLFRRIHQNIYHPRPFIRMPGYIGPCRRQMHLTPPGGVDRRRTAAPRGLPQPSPASLKPSSP